MMGFREIKSSIATLFQQFCRCASCQLENTHDTHMKKWSHDNTHRTTEKKNYSPEKSFAFISFFLDQTVEM